MASCPKHIVQYMHDYLDGELNTGAKSELKAHLNTCMPCKKHYLELKKTIALVQSASHVEAPAGFTERVLALLPKEGASVGARRWLRNHPLFTAASLFLIFMSGGIVSVAETENPQFAFTKNKQLIVENETVIVPADAVIHEDITVKNGNLRIEGSVDGDVTVINGERYLASAGHVTGEIKVIDRVFERIWFEVKSMFN